MKDPGVHLQMQTQCILLGSTIWHSQPRRDTFAGNLMILERLETFMFLKIETLGGTGDLPMLDTTRNALQMRQFMKWMGMILMEERFAWNMQQPEDHEVL